MENNIQLDYKYTNVIHKGQKKKLCELRFSGELLQKVTNCSIYTVKNRGSTEIDSSDNAYARAYQYFKSMAEKLSKYSHLYNSNVNEPVKLKLLFEKNQKKRNKRLKHYSVQSLDNHSLNETNAPSPIKLKIKSNHKHRNKNSELIVETRKNQTLKDMKKKETTKDSDKCDIVGNSANNHDDDDDEVMFVNEVTKEDKIQHVDLD